LGITKWSKQSIDGDECGRVGAHDAANALKAFRLFQRHDGVQFRDAIASYNLRQISPHLNALAGTGTE